MSYMVNDRAKQRRPPLWETGALTPYKVEPKTDLGQSPFPWVFGNIITLCLMFNKPQKTYAHVVQKTVVRIRIGLLSLKSQVPCRMDTPELSLTGILSATFNPSGLRAFTLGYRVESNESPELMMSSFFTCFIYFCSVCPVSDLEFHGILQSHIANVTYARQFSIRNAGAAPRWRPHRFHWLCTGCTCYKPHPSGNHPSGCRQLRCLRS